MNTTSLQSQAVTIRDESLASANTASRVGTLFVDTITAIDEVNQFKESCEAYIKMLQGTIIGTLGSYETWADAITALDAMRPTVHKSGRYTITIGGVIYPLTYIAAAAATGWQMIEGGIVIKSDGTLATDTTKYCTFVSRYYENNAWSAWQASAKTSDIPTPQSQVAGTSTNYVYSTGITSDLPHNVFSGVFKCYQYGGEVRVTHKLWGSSSNYDDGKFISSNIPTANSSSNGVLHREHYKRLINTTLTTEATDQAVTIHYPNYAEGGTKDLVLSRVSSAKAGLMACSHLNLLNQCVNDIKAIKEKLGMT